MYVSALPLSWPAENKAKRFSRSLTSAFSIEPAPNALFERQNRIAFFFCPANSKAKHFIFACLRTHTCWVTACPTHGLIT